jgi:hypothetical protein
LNRKVIGLAFVIGVYGTIIVDAFIITPHLEMVQKVEASQPITSTTVKEALIEITYSDDSVVKHIRETFPEAPNTAVAIAKCENAYTNEKGWRPDLQSGFILSYGREQSYGIMQVHAKAWDKEAKRLGYNKYRTDVMDNLKMARHIYEQAGNSFAPWTCYRSGEYKTRL